MGKENPYQISSESLVLEVLSRDFFNRKTEVVAKALLGKTMVRRIGNKVITGKIVEVEAYVGEEDPAAHAYVGRTERTKVLYGEPGHAYIFKIRGYHCLNAVAEEKDSPGCVLIRAVEPLHGIEKMKELRGGKIKKDTDLTNGPGKLCQAFNIDLKLYGADLVLQSSPLFFAETTGKEEFEIETSKRVGITKAADWELHFTIKGNKFVSR